METINRGDAYLEIQPSEIRALEENYLFATYKRYNVIFSHGQGAYLYDIEGKRYLDFLAGIAVNSLGYNHPRMVRVLLEQGQRLIHCSNLFYHPYQGQLARRLANLSGMEKVFFTNSGTEAIEAAIKFSRAYGHTRGGPEKSRILALPNSFHGRTFGALSVTAQEKYKAKFLPLLPEVQILEEISPAALEMSMNDGVCALIFEPIQGEGGIVPIPAEFAQKARELCSKYDALLVLDEIQCGLGRTGKHFAYQQLGITPDLVALAKPLGGGYPMGAVLGSGSVADCLQYGDHGTTFGGGPLACRLALEFLDVIDDEALLGHVADIGGYLVKGLAAMKPRHPSMGEIRGMGLILGIELGNIAKNVVELLLRKGIVANAAHDTVLRLLPPFIITRKEVDDFLKILDTVLSEAEIAYVR
jgi:predicted acetylornithine/succinylornithine family transaminase